MERNTVSEEPILAQRLKRLEARAHQRTRPEGGRKLIDQGTMGTVIRAVEPVAACRHVIPDQFGNPVCLKNPDAPGECFPSPCCGEEA